MSRVWLIFRKVLLLVLIAAAVLGVIYRKKIHEYYAVYQYAQTFKPDVIDQNFRSLYKIYPSIRVPHEGEISPLPYREQPLPETYVYQGETRRVADWLGKTQTTGFIVLKDGVVLHEQYERGNTAATQSIAMSMSKSTISFLIGNAVRDGLIRLDETVDRYAPELSEGGYKGVTVKNVLQMSSGIGFNENYGDLSSDIVHYIIQILTGSVKDFTAHLKNVRPQGTQNVYVSADTQVLAMVLEGATGKPFVQYFREKLWSRLGAEADAYWLADARGDAVAAGGLNAVLRDYARFGLLYMNEGRNFKGEQLVPAQWVHDSVTPDAPYLMPGRDDPQAGKPLGYGYQWWIPGKPQGDFVAVGIYGQFIYVNPQRKVVIAKTSAYADYNKTGQQMKDESIIALQAIADAL
jgi:CubicO group peptidase (beta-lactamase class C family)